MPSPAERRQELMDQFRETLPDSYSITLPTEVWSIVMDALGDAYDGNVHEPLNEEDHGKLWGAWKLMRDEDDRQCAPAYEYLKQWRALFEEHVPDEPDEGGS